MEGDRELRHYGVLGMKWGKRKNPERAYEKANKKMSKLDARATKMQSKAYRRQDSIFKSSRKRAKATQEEADRLKRKAARWYRSVEKVLGTTKAREMSHDNINMGERYAHYLIYGR